MLRPLSQKIILLSMALFFCVSSCTIYRSPERKNFESEYPQFKVKNLKVSSCSNQTVAAQSMSSKLIEIINANDQNSIFIWEHVFINKSVFESNNLKGDYCIYE